MDWFSFLSCMHIHIHTYIFPSSSWLPVSLCRCDAVADPCWRSRTWCGGQPYLRWLGVCICQCVYAYVMDEIWYDDIYKVKSSGRMLCIYVYVYICAKYVPPPLASRPCWWGLQATAFTAAVWSVNLHNGSVSVLWGSEWVSEWVSTWVSEWVSVWWVSQRSDSDQIIYQSMHCKYDDVPVRCLRLPHIQFVVVPSGRQHTLVEGPFQPAYFLFMTAQLYMHN